MPAQRLADQDGPLQHQLISNGGDVGDVGSAGDVLRVALAGAVPALVDRNDSIPGAQAPCQHVPFTRVTGQAGQRHDRLPRPPQSRQASRKPSRTSTCSDHATAAPGNRLALIMPQPPRVFDQLAAFEAVHLPNTHPAWWEAVQRSRGVSRIVWRVHGGTLAIVSTTAAS